MTWQTRAKRIVHRVKPVTSAVERVAQIAVHLARPTPLGVLAAVSAGINSVQDSLSPGSNRRVPVFASPDTTVAALRTAGVACTHQRNGRHSTCWRFIGEHSGTIYEDEWLYIESQGPRDAQVAWLRGVFDAMLPDAWEVRRRGHSNSGSNSSSDTAGYDGVPTRLTSVQVEEAGVIWAATAPLLAEGPRCVLLDGAPGVGKTTAAQAIARDARIGRTVLLGNDALDGRDGWSNGDFGDALAMLSPGVVIVDDVDKVRVNLERLERVRAAARLVVLTANNGQHDEVLDGALIRAGRVDEVFHLAAVAWPRAAPFDALDDEAWTEVSQWPAAYLQEVRRRLEHRPDALRLDDLRARLQRRVRSGEVLR